MQRICIFAGSSSGVREEYTQATQELGQELVRRGKSIVYGGAGVGLMGQIANTALAAGGDVTGVMPQGLFRREVGHIHLSTMHQVGSMHERKALMADLADGFIALPGGFGTFDELFEIITWAQIGLHNKPIGLLNVADYYSPLVALIEHAIREGFVHTEHTRLFLLHSQPDTLLDAMEAFQSPPTTIKWGEIPPER